MRYQNLRQLIGTLVAMAAVIGLPAVAFADITNSSHDFMGVGWTVDPTEICIVCHTPHDADTTVTTAPLWNHDVTSVASYSVYTSDTLNATTGQPDGVSKLCLSCHDGSVALDSYGGLSGTEFLSSGDFGYIGTDLSDDHPISFVWTDAGIGAEDSGLNSVTDASGLGGTIDEDMLFGTKLQCASCHDPHGVPGVPSFLVKSNAASDLCLTCHNK
jgi:predicted CXXCH cytochrome family protein